MNVQSNESPNPVSALAPTGITLSLPAAGNTRYDMQIKHNMTRLAASVALAGSLALAGCGSKDDAPPPQGPAEVGVITLSPQSLDVTTTLPGRTTAYQIAEVRPQIGGIVQKRLFREGSDVKAGAVLYQIDPAVYQATYDSARASLARAEATAQQARLRSQRYEELVAIKAVSQQEYDDASAALKQAEADVAAARAAVTTARINLDYTRVTAPISGRIGKSSVTPGALLTANQADSLTTVQQLDPIYVDVTQSSAELLKLRRAIESGAVQREGGKVKVSLIQEDGSRYAREGVLEFSDVTVDPQTGSVTLRALFPNPQGELLPGLYVRASLTQGRNSQAILVPHAGVSHDARGNAVVMVVNQENKVEARVVKAEQATADSWVVSEGVKAGERIIVEGLQKAKPGDVVKAVDTAAASAGNTAPAAQPAAK